MEVIIIKNNTKTKKLIPGTFDPVFKEIFTCKECRNYTCALISKITNINFDYLKENLKVVNTTLPVDRARERSMTTDVLLSIEGNIINLEMNNRYYEGLYERNDKYGHKVLSRLTNKGEKYSDYNKLIQINFNSFNKFKKEISVFKMMEVDTHELESESFIKYHISLPIITKKYYNKEKLSALEKMLLLIAINEIKDLEKVSMGDDILMEYEKKIKNLSDDERFLDLYDVEEENAKIRRTIEAYDKKIATEKGMKKGLKQGLKKGIEQGIEQGIKQGIKQGIEKGITQEKNAIAKNMLEKGIAIDTIIEVTGIDKATLKEIDK